MNDSDSLINYGDGFGFRAAGYRLNGDGMQIADIQKRDALEVERGELLNEWREMVRSGDGDSSRVREIEERLHVIAAEIDGF